MSVIALARRTCVLLGLLGAGLMLVAGSRSWASVSFHQAFPAAGELAVAGRHVAPTVVPVALAAVAATVLLAIGKRAVLVVVGLGLVLAGVGSAVAATVAAADRTSLAAIALREAVGLDTSGTAALGSPVDVTINAWAYVAVAGAVLLAMVGLAAVVAGPRWSRPTGRYERAEPAGPSEPAPARPSASAWDALSQGQDPTIDEG